MKLSDYVADFLAKQGLKHTFGITGGAIVHILDSIYSNPEIKHVCTTHEQVAAMAADAYSRLTGNFGVAIATSGPGATNLVTGICCSYFDSIPVLLITGQVPRSQLKKGSKARQIGFQETDIVGMFSSITKYGVIIEDPDKIRYELEKALYIAKSGRPGPVILDLPDDVQRAEIDPSKLEGFTPPDSKKVRRPSDEDIALTIKLLKEAERPVLILGGGIKLAKAEKQALALAERLKVPVALTWATKDMLPFDHPLVVEGFGVSSERAGNFVVQNSDFILALGTRLDTHETGNNMSTFAPEAEKVIVDIDPSELEKYGQRGMLKANLLVNCDVTAFLDKMSAETVSTKDMSGWMARVNDWKARYPICLDDYRKQKDNVNPYVFMDALSKESKEGDIVITDAGGNLTWTMQGYRVKKDQKLFSAFNHSPMGYAMPASIGAAFTTKEPIICITGDGSIQMNIQDLATIKHNNLPIQIFLLNNDGYGIMQQTQDTWLGSRYAATNPDFGVAIPDFLKIAEAYGIPTVTIRNHDELKEGIRRTLDHHGPVLCNVLMDRHQKIEPKLEFGKPIEDSSPLMDRDEFNKNMIIKPK
ncbi:thiamine pyrophosphate-binding protein [Nanoarchaeota archaeon]